MITQHDGHHPRALKMDDQKSAETHQDMWPCSPDAGAAGDEGGGAGSAELPGLAVWHLLAQDFARQGPRDYGRLRQVQATGEAMPPEGVKAWREAGLGHVKLLNTYGPTETVVTAIALDCAAHLSAEATLPLQMPIGHPLAARHAYVLDADLNLTCPGVPGELYIGGALLARGYHGRAGLSAERFIADPFDAAGGRLYRTGDVARWNHEGELEYLDRVDHQVKLRGFRIELGEIEAQLLSQPGVREAVVVARTRESGTQLVGYVAVADHEVLAHEIKAQLQSSLPEYMVPSAIVVSASLPKNANGKIDRAALPQPPELTDDRSYEPPQGGVERAIADIWADVLGVERIGRRDNFFQLGGHSMILLKLLKSLHTRFGDESVALADLFNCPILQQQAGWIEERVSRGGVDAISLSRTTRGDPLYCFTGIYGNGYEFAEIARVVGDERPVYGFVCHTLSKERWVIQSLESLAAKHVEFIVKTARTRRCALLGWSCGGDLAFETAHQLRGIVDVQFVGLVDASDREDTFDLSESAVDPQVWIATSRMRRQWMELLNVMRPEERTTALHFLRYVAATLPQDGPDVGTREYKAWASLRLAWMTRNSSRRALHLPVHVWSAETTLHDRRLRSRHWLSFTDVAADHVIAGVTHRSLLDHPELLHTVAACLRESDVADRRKQGVMADRRDSVC